MRAPGKHQQNGYILMLTLLMFMGIGGVVLASFTQQARQELEDRKYQHNQRVLEEAKRALLLFAYNYPQSNPGIGPGRLPCPDHDNDGDIDFPLDCATVGRFPWRDTRLDTPELRDASGETLWYAVSNSFDNGGGGGVINSDTQGNITLLDRNGQILYDGRAAGLAAVIIAPGERLRRDNDGDGVYEYEQVRVLGDPDQRDPTNYLDTYTLIDTAPDPDVVIASYDNSRFTNNEFNTDDDPLIIGPIFDPQQSEYVVNDQLIIITADEVIEMAEKAVLDAYRDAIIDYQEILWGTPANPNYRYPWLSAWNDTSDLDVYNPQVGATTGRVPMYDYYFVDQNAPRSIVISDLEIFFDLHITYNSMVDNADPFDPTYIAAAVDVVNNYPESDQTINISNAELTFSRTSFDGVADVTTDDIGTVIVRDNGSSITASYGPNRVRRYFWDGCPTCFEAADGWEMCPFLLGDGRDCAKDQDPPYNFELYSDWADHADIRVRMIEFEYIDPEFVIELDYSIAPIVGALQLPTSASHARIKYTFDENAVTAMPIVDPNEPDSRNFFDIRVSLCDQDNFVGSGLNLNSLGNADSGTIFCTVDLDLDVSSNYHDDLEFTVEWHPRLPRWIIDNRWDEAVMMSYMPDFAPGGDGACTADADPATPAADDCLVISNLAGANNNFNAVLILAGEHDLIDGDDLNLDGDWDDPNEDPPDLDYSNDLQDIFEPENYSGLWPHPVPNNDPTPASDTGQARVFDKREQAVPGNRPDKLFVIN